MLVILTWKLNTGIINANFERSAAKLSILLSVSVIALPRDVLDFRVCLAWKKALWRELRIPITNLLNITACRKQHGHVPFASFLECVYSLGSLKSTRRPTMSLLHLN